jgi:putative transposase
MVAFIDDHRDEFDVESICRVLPIASSTYYAAKRREREPSARAISDAVWLPILLAWWLANRKVYGALKLWKAARRAGHDIGRDQVARLMRQLGIDAFSRRIVGWRVASNMRTQMVLDALEMARRSRGVDRFAGLVTHADAGSQFTSVRFTERLDEIGARPSIGTVADSFDNALAETTNGLYKTECVRGPDARHGPTCAPSPVSGPASRPRSRSLPTASRARADARTPSAPHADASHPGTSRALALPHPRVYSGLNSPLRHRTRVRFNRLPPQGM